MVVSVVYSESQKLTPAQRSLLPTSEDIDFYQRHGWYISKQLFSDEVIDDLRQGIERFYAGDRDARLPIQLQPLEDWQPGSDRKGVRINEFLVQQNQQAFELSRNPILGAISALLTGSLQIRLFSSSLYYKPPKDPAIDPTSDITRIGWHHDRGYWKTCTSENMISAWIPLHDCDEDMGTLTMIDGSHRWHSSTPSNQWFAHFANSDPKQQTEVLVRHAKGKRIQAVPMVLRKGQVSFHHCLTFHGSPPNLSDRPRIALSFHMQDRENRYRQHWKENGELQVHNNDRLCRKLPDGTPDYTDPVFCPVLWEERLTTNKPTRELC